MWLNNKFIKYGTSFLLFLLIIFMLGKIDFAFAPAKSFIASIIIPVLIAGLFTYLLRPLVALLEKLRLPRTAAILLSFVIPIFLFVMIAAYTGSIVVGQFTQFTNDLPRIIEIAKQKADITINYDWFQYLPSLNLEEKFAGFLGKATNNVSTFIFDFVGTVTSIGTIILLVPFLLFYFLKDGSKLPGSLIKVVPAKHKDNILRVISDVDSALSAYIQGQMLVALFIGVMMYIGYLIIGMKYAVVMAIFAMITSIIPFFGPVIGIIPAMLIGLTMNPFMVIKIIATAVIVQQIDGNFVSPQVMRRSLDIHPVTVILILTGCVSFFGVIGLIVSIPLYAAIKVTVKNIYEMYFAHKSAR